MDYVMLARGLLELYFATAAAANLSEEQKIAMYEEEKKKFDEKDPAALVAH